MKKLNFVTTVSVLLSVFLVISCNEITLDKNLKKNRALPDLSLLINDSSFAKGKEEIKIKSLEFTKYEKLRLVKEDKALVKINSQDLFLESFSEVKDIQLIDNINNKPFNEKNYILQTNEDNKIFLRKVSKSHSIRENSGVKKLIENTLYNKNLNDMKYFKLNWNYKKERFNTFAIFIGEDLIYDQILNYLVFNSSSPKLSISKKKVLKEMSASCDSLLISGNIQRSYTINNTKTTYWGGIGAWGYASVTFYGYYDASSGKKYINRWTKDNDGSAAYGYSFDSKSSVTNFLPAGIGVDGSGTYEIAVAIGGPNYYSSGVSLSFNGFSFTLNPSSMTPNSVESEGGYVTPSELPCPY